MSLCVVVIVAFVLSVVIACRELCHSYAIPKPSAILIKEPLVSSGSREGRVADEAGGRIATRDLYASLLTLIVHTETTRWNRFYNFLMANSVLLLGWATLYGSPNRGNARLVMVLICVVGMISGSVWAGLGKRGSAYVDLHFNQASSIEMTEWLWANPADEIVRPLHVGDRYIRSAKGLCSSNPMILTYGPIALLIVYTVCALVSVMS